MENKIKVLGILLLAGFSFFYTDKVSTIIKENDPIMTRINEVKDDMVVSKIDGIIMNDEYITGINGCVVDEKESYNKMKNVGEFKEELLVMKEDKIEENDNLYIVGGNKEKRNVSIILLDLNKDDDYIKNNNIKINYFFDGSYIKNYVDKIIKKSKYSKIYYYGRNGLYDSKYIVYDNSLITTNFNNNSDYCLVHKKNEKELNLCSSYKMRTIKSEIIKDNKIEYVKHNLENGKILVFENNDDLNITIKYILSKGYNIVFLDELLNEKNNCD